MAIELILDKLVDPLRHIGFILFKLFVALVGGYVVGYVISEVIKKVLRVEEFQKTLVKYGAVTSHLWNSIINFIGQFIKWYTIIFLLYVLFNQDVFFKEPVYFLFVFFTSLLFFVVLVIIGLLLGGVLHKITKDTLVAIGLEAELEKHKVADSLGGVPLSTILASIVKWYVVLVFLNEGVTKLGLPVLSNVIGNLLAYVPNAILGLLIILATLIIVDFTGTAIRKRRVAFSEFLALIIEIVIVFFGAVLALPKFGITNISILEDSFKILLAGVAIGIAIAMGLGLKDAISDTAKHYEKEIIEHKK